MVSVTVFESVAFGRPAGEAIVLAHRPSEARKDTGHPRSTVEA
jgi:hypothetical protein